MWALCCGVWILWVFSKFPCVQAISHVLWCVWTLKFFKVPMCVGPVLWCVGTLSFFKIPCVWALCCGVWGLWNFLKFPCVWALCCGVWGLWVFQSSPVCETLSLCWRDWVFTKKSLYWGFSPVLERLVFSGQNPWWWRSKAVKKNVVYDCLYCMPKSIYRQEWMDVNTW